MYYIEVEHMSQSVEHPTFEKLFGAEKPGVAIHHYWIKLLLYVALGQIKHMFCDKLIF